MSKIWNWIKPWRYIKRIFGADSEKANLIGVDDLGNKYYERDRGDKKRPARWYGSEENKYIDIELDDIPDIPLEWDSWLRGGRKDAPTQEEIDANRARSRKTVMRARSLEKTAAEEKATEMTDGKTESATRNDQSSKFPTYPEYEDQPGKKRREPK